MVQLYSSASLAIENFHDFQIKNKLANKISLAPTSLLDKELAALEKIGGKIITYKNPNYPIYLRQIYDFPITISYFGNIELALRQCIAIVGARNCSANGFRYSYLLAKQATEKGYVVVSGLARGIDTAAHKASPANTIACLAGGVDYIYPEENKGLYEEIKQEGLIISEMPLGTVPKPTHFPMRNRIISGLSEAVIVVEAAINSGSLITARSALEQNRDVYAVPCFPGDPRSRGTIKLLKEGAYIMEDFDDYKKTEKKITSNVYIEEIVEEDDQELSIVREDHERIILQQINRSEISIDEIVAITGLPVNIVLAYISKLELESVILRQSNNKVVKI